ncbi:hypothetical protein EVAR_29315_1 [Eumeta japonica]|uniref:Reverse transcriptase domain-containing protein n=1 Tax=Eumeta variegata TaxID=151549 RepID=A0A4C1WK79_EUMVA|nr:hypothetical protein EVAR_29315_1 [Eumeta japonica]
MDELSVKCLLYADDQVILALSACVLQDMVDKMIDSVKKRDMKVNVGASSSSAPSTRSPALSLSYLGLKNFDRAHLPCSSHPPNAREGSLFQKLPQKISKDT